MQVIFSLVVFVLCLSCGTIAIVFRPTAVASWLFFTGMLLLAAELGLDYQVAKAASAAEISTWLWRGLLLKSLDPGIWLSFSLVYARGNQGEFLSHWKWFLVVAWLLPVALIFGFPQRVFESAESSNALAIQLGWAGKAWVMVVITAILAILVNFEKTFRASVGMARWRIKYLILGVGLIFGVRVYTLSQMLLFSGYRSEVANLTLVSLFLGCILNGVGQVRSSFGALDIYPSRAVLQGSVTVILAGAYFIIVGLLAQSVALLGGIANFPAQALVLLLGVVGVAVMMLSERFRMALRRFISCHFRRPEHDFREIWTEFTRRTSSVLDAVTLGKNAANVISESFHVLGVTVVARRTNHGGSERDKMWRLDVILCAREADFRFGSGRSEPKRGLRIRPGWPHAEPGIFRRRWLLRWMRGLGQGLVGCGPDGWWWHHSGRHRARRLGPEG